MRTLLVVDDDEDVRFAIQQALEGSGLHVVTAPDGLAALDLLRSGECRPDAILLDLMMPRMGGQEFLREKSKIPDFARTPVVLITASDVLLARAAAAEDPFGVTMILQKPFSVDQLMRVLAPA